MRTVQNILIAATLILAVGATFAWAQTNSKEIMARPPAELVEILKNPKASAFEKAKACQRLAVVGTKDAVPALAALLADEKLNVYARFGLEGIPDPAADAALRDAAAKLRGPQLIGVLNSIGQRRDVKALKLLKRLFLINTDPAIVGAVAGALGQIGTTGAADVLRESLGRDQALRLVIAEGCLVCADRLVTRGKKAEADKILEAVVKADVPKHVKIAALGGQFRIRQGAAKDLLLAQIRNPDKAHFDLGLAVARDMAGADVTVALAAELDKLPPERQALLLRALADRKDPPPMPAVLAAGKSQLPAVRQAAIYVLARHGDASSASILLDAALGDAEVAQAAKEGIVKLAGQGVDAAIVARLAGADPKTKVVLFELLGARRIVAATPAIREAVADANESVRLAAIASLGQLAELVDIDLLGGKALAGSSPAETAAAQSALKMAALRMSDRDACALKLASRLNGASVENQVYLLGLLGKVSGQRALETVAACVKSGNPAVKDAAARTLGEWPGADAAPMLLDIVKTDGDAKYQLRALRGYIRIARQFQLPAETKLAMFRTVMEVAKRNDEKKLALDILTRIPSATTLGLAVSHLGDGALKDSAADAAVKIAEKVIRQEPKAVAEAMQKVVDANAAAPVAARAKQLLGQAQAAAK